LRCYISKTAMFWPFFGKNSFKIKILVPDRSHDILCCRIFF
jgi:hypothetical protein